MKLSTQIVSYNARDALSACLDSVQASTGVPESEVVVVDNASSDGSAAMVRERFPSVVLVALDENVGFARASNLGWRRSTGELVLFLNGDTVLPPTGLRRLVDIMDAGPDIGVLGPRLRTTDGSIEMSYGTMMSLSAELRQKLLNAGYRGGRGPLRRTVEAMYGRERTVDWVSGAALLARRALLESIRGFDEEFFLYSEDVDLCARIRGEGARVVFTPEVDVVHHRGRSADTNRDRAFVESQRSRLYFYAKHYGQPRLALLKLYVTLKLGLAYLVRPSSRRAYRSVLDEVFHGDGA